MLMRLEDGETLVEIGTLPEEMAKVWLRLLYPRAFGFHYKPLAIGTGRLVLDQNPGAPFSARVIRRTIRMRTKHHRYLMALAADGAKRYSLNGKPVGPVSYADMVAARRELAKRRRERSPRFMR
jgi:sRNA-binding protein